MAKRESGQRVKRVVQFLRVNMMKKDPTDFESAVRLTYGPQTSQEGELSVPASSGPHPVVLLIHGGFWRTPYDLDLMRGMAGDLVRQDIAVWNIDYRRIGDPGGGWPETLRDVARAADYLQTIATTYALDLQRVVTVGHSAGGHLALWLAARARLDASGPLAIDSSPLAVTGVVSLAGVNDLEHAWQLRLGNNAVGALLGGDPRTYPERYHAASPAAQLPLGVPQVLVHGSTDRNVPLVISEDYVRKATAAGDQITLLTLPNADHFVVIDARSTVWPTIRAAILRLFAMEPDL